MDNSMPLTGNSQSRPFPTSTRFIAWMGMVFICIAILKHWAGFNALNKFLAVGIVINLLLSPAIRPQWVIFKYLKERERDRDYFAMDAYCMLMLLAMLFT